MSGTTITPVANSQDVNRLLSELWSELGMVRPNDAPSIAQPDATAAPTVRLTPQAQQPATVIRQEAPQAPAVKPALPTPVTAPITAAKVATPTNSPAPQAVVTKPTAKSDAADPLVPLPSSIGYFPKAPRSLKEAGVSADEVGRTVLKLLAARGAHTGRKIAAHIRLLFPMVDEVLRDLRKEQFVVLKGEAIAGDYTYVVTEKGMSIAK